MRAKETGSAGRRNAVFAAAAALGLIFATLVAFPACARQRAKPPAMTSSEQAAFVVRFRDLTQVVSQELTIWSFTYDPRSAGVPFDSIGLFRPDGTPRPAWEEWTRP